MACNCDSTRGVFTASVLSNDCICPGHCILRLQLERFPATRPGQFIQLQCRYPTQQVSNIVDDWPPGKPPTLSQPELTDREPFLRRPLSLAGRRDGPAGAELTILYRQVGTGTRWLAGLETEAQISLLGPLGNAFVPPPGKPLAALVGGGVGIPPLVYLAHELSRAGAEATAFCGARSGDALPVTVVPGAAVDPAGTPAMCIAEFAARGIPAAVTTDDGSLGLAGNVTRAFATWLDGLGRRADSLAVYSCGPEPMMRAVAELCISRDIPCQVAMERQMACGMGTCQSCVVKIRDDSDRGWSYRLCCSDGPVFDARQVIWQ